MSISKPFRSALRAAALVLACLPSLCLATATINLGFTPPTINPGDPATIDISIYNSGINALTSDAVTVALPSGVTLASSPSISDSCGFSSVSAPGGGSLIVLSGGTTPAAMPGGADGSCTFSASVNSVAAGNHTMTLPADGPANGFVPGGATAGFSADENGTTITNATPASTTLLVSSLTAPTGAITFTPSTVYLGETTTLKVTLTNNNATVSLPLTSFTDSLPAGFSIAATPSPSIVCAGGTAGTLSTPSVGGAVTAGDTSITLTGGTIAGGGTCVMQLNVTAAANAPVGSVTNSVAANAIGNTRGLGSAAFSRSVTVGNPVSISQTFTPNTTARSGAAIQLRITISNASAANALNITNFTDNLTGSPAPGVVIDAGVTPAISCTGTGASNGTLTATPGAASLNLANAVAGKSGSCQITVGVSRSNDGAVTSTSVASTTPSATQMSNAGVAPADLPVSSSTASGPATVSQFTVAKSSSVSNPYPGQPFNYTVTISNWSPGAVGNVNFADTLPTTAGNQLVLSAGSSLGAGCSGGTLTATAGTSIVSWTGGTIATGSGSSAGTCTITIATSMDTNAALNDQFVNTLPANTAVTGTDVNSRSIANTNSTSATATAGASVTVNQSFSPTSIVQGNTSLLTVTVKNPTASALTNATFTEALDSHVTVAAVPTIATTCTGSPVLTATPGANAFSAAGLTVPTGNTGCTVSLYVTSSTVGAWSNTLGPLAVTDDQGLSNGTGVSKTLTVTSALTASAAFSPNSTGLTGSSRLTITLNNPGAVALSNVSVTNPLQTGANAFVVAATPAASTTCAGSPTVTAVAAATSVSMTGATMAAGTSCALSFNVTTTAGGGWTNTIPVGNITSAQGPSNTSSVTASLSKVSVIIGINKSFTPNSITGGTASTLRIDLNSPPGAASAGNGVAFTDTFPNGMEVYSIPNTATTCPNGVVSAIGGDNKVSLSGADLSAGGSCYLTVDVTSIKSLNLTNTIGIGAVTSQQGFSNTVATSATLSTLQGLGVEKSFSPTAVAPGQPATLTVKLISTLNSIDLTNVSVTDTLPAGVVIAANPNLSTTCSASPTGTAGGSSAAISGVTLTPQSNCTFSVNVTAASVGTYVNTIAIGDATSAELYANQTAASATLNVMNAPTVSPAFGTNPVQSGANSLLTITLANTNATALTGAALTNVLPAGLSVALTPSAATNCTGGSVVAAAAGGTISLTGATIPANGSCYFRANVSSNTPAAYTNTIAAGALTTTQGISNAVAGTATLTVLQLPTVTQAFSPSAIAPSAVSQLTLTLGNTNASAITLSAAFTDTLPVSPGNLVVATPNGLAKTCPGTVTASGGTITYANGASIPAGGCTIAVNVTTATVGTYTNTIPAGALQTSAGNSQSASVATLTVSNNTPPVAAAFSASVNDTALTPVSIGPMSATATAPATVTSYAIVSLPSAALGTLYCGASPIGSVPTNCAANQVGFLPVASAVGVATFTYTATDSNALTSSAATATVTVNGPPSAQALSLAVNNNAAVAVSVGTLAGTPQGGATIASYAIATLPGATLHVYCNGTLVSSVPAACAPGQVTVLPVSAPSATVTFDYTATDSNGMTSVAATVTVRFNTPPTANAVTTAAINSNAATQTVAALSAAATTSGATIASYAVTGLPTAGTLYCGASAIVAVPTSCAANNVGFRPSGASPNPVTFTYAATDSNGMTSTGATYTIPLNTAPTASAVSNGTVSSTAVTAQALSSMSGTATTAGATIVVYTIATLPATGTLYCSAVAVSAVPTNCAAAALAFLPAGVAVNPVTFTYTVTDSNGMVSAPATFSVPLGLPGTADSFSVAINNDSVAPVALGTMGGTAVGGATITLYTVTTLPSGATLYCSGTLVSAVPATCAAAGLAAQPVGNPTAPTSVSYTVTYSNAAVSSPATISVTWNTPPTANAIGTTLNSAIRSPQALPSMTGSATTAGATLTTFRVTSLPSAAKGVLYCSGSVVASLPATCAAAALTFLPANAATGSATFTYTVTDSNAMVSAAALATITLRAPPVASPVAAGPFDSTVATPQALPALNGTALTPGATISTYTVTTLPDAAIGRLYCANVQIGAVPAACAANALSFQVTTLGATQAQFSYAVTDSNGLVSTAADVTIALLGSPALTLHKSSAGPMTVGFDTLYTLQVANRSPYTATQGAITVTDTLPAALDFIAAAGAAAPSAWTCTWNPSSRLVSCSTTAIVAANGNAEAILLHVAPNAAAVGGGTSGTVSNTATVAGGGELPSYANGTAPGAQPHSSIDTQTVRAASVISGSSWIDLNHNGVKDAGEPVPEPGSVRVEVWPTGTTAAQAAAGTPIASVVIDTSGRYSLTAPPGIVQVRFVNMATNSTLGNPVNGETNASRNQPSVTGSDGVVAHGVIENIQLTAGATVTQQSLPVDPQGFVYDVATRLPIGGASVTLSANGSPVPAACLSGGANPFVTAANGAFAGGYQFLLDFSAPGCASLSGTTFALAVTAAGYTSPSRTIPPGAGGTTTFHAPAGSGLYPIVTKPGIPAAGDPTTYYLAIVLGATTVGVGNNNIPLDGATRTGLAVTKSASKATAEVGDLVRYTVVVRNTGNAASQPVVLTDSLPLGFKLVDKTASVVVGGVTQSLASPGLGPVLTFSVPAIAAGASATLQYVVRIGIGADRGDGVNRVRAVAGGAVSNEASATVKVSGGVFGSDACLLGKVFMDCNGDGVQGANEPGVSGVRLWLETGVSITTDRDGKFSYCGLSAHTHAIKIDRATLPAGAAPHITSNRNLGDPGSLLLDVKDGELARADFALGECAAAPGRPPGEAAPPGRQRLRFESRDAAQGGKHE